MGTFAVTAGPARPAKTVGAAAGAIGVALTEAAASAARTAVRLVGSLITAWEENPPPIARAGKLAPRDIRRTALALDVDDEVAQMLIDIAEGARLIIAAATPPPPISRRVPTAESGRRTCYLVTTRADDWEAGDEAARWAMLAAPFARFTGSPSATTEFLGLTVAGAPSPLGQGAQDRSHPASPVHPDEGRTHGEHATYSGRAQHDEPAQQDERARFASAAQRRHDMPRSGEHIEAELAAALRAILPPAVDEMLLQGDLTGIVPGRPTHALATLLENSAVIESQAAATTVRFTPASIARALRRGASADGLLAELAAFSRTPIPQPLEYLVHDAARLATTTPAGRGAHISAPRRRRADPGTWHPPGVLALLRDALAQRGAPGGSPGAGLVVIEFVDGHGRPMRRHVKPLGLDGGRLRALDPERETELTIAVHRIVSAGYEE